MAKDLFKEIDGKYSRMACMKGQVSNHKSSNLLNLLNLLRSLALSDSFGPVQPARPTYPTIGNHITKPSPDHPFAHSAHNSLGSFNAGGAVRSSDLYSKLETEAPKSNGTLLAH